MRLPDPRRSRCVLIGVGRYAAEELPDLPAVADNLAGLSGLLADPRLGGIEPGHVATVLDPTGPHQAGSAVLAAAEEAADLLLVYVAGRITRTTSGEPQLLLGGAGARRHAAALPLRLIRTAVQDSAAARRIVVVDGLLHGDTAQAEVADRMLVDRLTTVPGAAALLHRTADPAAYVTPGRAGTAFTRALLDAALARGAGPGLADLRTLAHWAESRLAVPAAAGGRHRAASPPVYLHNDTPPWPLLRTSAHGEAPTPVDVRLLDDLHAAAAHAEHDFDHPADAAQCYRRLVLQSQRAVGLDHPATNRARRILARWQGLAGATADAVAVLAELHAAQLAALGPHDPQTAATARDLSYWSQR